MQDVNTIAADVTVNRSERVMTIVWSDEHRSSFDFPRLRSICPCAFCDTTKHGGPLRDDDSMNPAQFAGITVQDVQEVGRYALRFVWSDGHDSGIYSYEFLRKSCGCEDCKKLFN